MEQASLRKKYESELAAINKQIETAKDNLHDALLRIAPHSIKDTTSLIIRLEEERRHTQICLDALYRKK